MTEFKVSFEKPIRDISQLTQTVRGFSDALRVVMTDFTRIIGNMHTPNTSAGSANAPDGGFGVDCLRNTQTKNITAAFAPAGVRPLTAIQQSAVGDNARSITSTLDSLGDRLSRAFESSNKKLLDAIERLNQNLAPGAPSTTPQGGAGGGTGGGTGGVIPTEGQKPPPPNRWATASMWAKGIGAVAGVGLAAAQTFYTADLAMRQTGFQAERRAVGFEAQFAQRRYQEESSAFDMTKAENILKYNADVLFGQKYADRNFEFIGRRGRERAFEASQLEMKDRLEMDIVRKRQGMISGWGAVGLGAITVAGGVLGSLAGPGGSIALGGAAFAYGLSQMMGGAGQAAAAREGSQVNRLEGGTLTDSMLGDIALGRDRSRKSREILRESWSEAGLQQLEAWQDRQAKEVQKQPRTLSALNTWLQGVETRTRGAELVGRYAVSGMEVLGYDIDPRTGKLAKVADLEKYKTYIDEERPYNRKAFLSGLAAMGVAYGGKDVDANIEALSAKAQQEMIEKPWLRKVTTVHELMAERYIHPTEKLSNITDPRMAAYRQAYDRTQLEETKQRITDSTFETEKIKYQMDAASRLGLSAPEFGKYENTLANYMGKSTTNAWKYGKGGIAAQISATEGMVWASRTGMGTFEQLMGNLANINTARGGQDNTQILKEVFGNAIAAGFDKSRVAQKFATSVDELTRHLNITNITKAASDLGIASRYLSLGKDFGKIGDERSLELAKRGLEQYSQFTAQSGGIVGLAKSQSLYGAGGTLATGNTIMQKMGTVEINAAMGELEPGGKITSRRIQTLVDLAGGGETGRKAVLERFKKEKADAITGFKSVYALSTEGRSFDVDVAELNTLRADPTMKKEYEQKQALFVARAGNAGAMTQGFGEEGGYVLAFDVQRLPGQDPKAAHDAYLRHRSASQEVATDRAKQQNQMYYNSLARQFLGRSAETPIMKEEYLNYAKSLEQQGRFGELVDEKGRQYLAADIEKMSAPDVEARIKTQKLERTEMARVMYEEAATEGGNQAVRISNLGDLKNIIINSIKEAKNPGSTIGEDDHNTSGK